MAASVQVEEVTGAFGSEHFEVKNATGDTSRYYTTDSYSSDATTNPIPIPNDTDQGVSGSYWKTHLLNVTSTPSEYIENIRYYVSWTSHPSSQWSLGYGGDHIIGVSSSTADDCRIHSQGFPSSQYDQAEGAEGEFGYFMSGGTGPHSYYDGCTNGHYKSTWAFSSQGGALMVQSGMAIDATSGDTTGRTWCIATQVLVASGAVQESKTPVTATFVYDEV